MLCLAGPYLSIDLPYIPLSDCQRATDATEQGKATLFPTTNVIEVNVCLYGWAIVTLSRKN